MLLLPHRAALSLEGGLGHLRGRKVSGLIAVLGAELPLDPVDFLIHLVDLLAHVVDLEVLDFEIFVDFFHFFEEDHHNVLFLVVAVL